MATLTITEPGDGTGAVATVAGSGAGTVNVVNVGKANGETGDFPFTLGGSRVGDGTINLALGRGLWFAYLLSGATFSGMVYFAVSSGQTAVASRVRRSVADTIRLLPIPPAQKIYEQAFPDMANVTFPCTLCTVEGVQETKETGLSTLDYIGRPVRVAICDRKEGRELRVEKLEVYEFWRQSMTRCFIEQQLAGIPESVHCNIEPYVILDPNLPQFEHMVSGFVVRAICREPRGVGV